MLEIRATADAPLGTRLADGLRGVGESPSPVSWRARVTDDGGHVWRSESDSAGELGLHWEATSGAAGPVAAVASLRPLAIDLRAELADGRDAARTVRRRLLADGVRVRRWRGLGTVPATLMLPPPATAPRAALVLPPGASAPTAAVLAGAGAAVVLPVAAAADTTATAIGTLATLLAAVPAVAAAGLAAEQIADDPGPPPGLPARTPADVAAWAALLARLSQSRD